MEMILYTFNPGGMYGLHTVKVDTDTLAVWCESDGLLIDVATAEMLGYSAGDEVNYFCNGTTKYRARAQYDYPFAFLMPPQLNSLDCGYIPPTCDLVISDINTTDETEPGLNDGTAEIIASSSVPPIQYSLDDITYQFGNTFAGLAPGIYTVYTIDGVGCTASSIFGIAEGIAPVPGDPGAPDAPTTPFPYESVPCHFFKLNEVNISEPIKWDSINVVGKRDKDFHGWNYQFTDGVIDLEFDCAAGADLIREEYNLNGSDGSLVFKYGYTFEGIDHILFIGKLDLNTLKEYPSKFACAVVRYDGNEFIETRNDVKISLAATESVDGQPITAPTPETVLLHGKQIIRRFSTNRTTASDVINSLASGGFAYTIPETSSPALAEIETFYGYPLQTESGDIVADQKFLLDVRFGSEASITVKFDITFVYYFVALLGPANCTAQAYLSINGVDTAIGAPINHLVNNIPFLLSVDQTVLTTLAPGDKVYIYVKHTASGTGIFGIATREDTSAIYVETLESVEDSETNGWLIFDTLNHVIKAITNGTSALKSDFLRRRVGSEPLDGPGALNLITNGYQIRKYLPASRPLVIDLKTILESLRALFCIGVQYDDTRVVVERVDYFYQPVEIYFCDDVKDLVKEVARELLYNQIEIGYDKYQDEGYNSLDEFNTRHELITPIKTHKGKLVQKSKFIASGYSIETSRREQFNATATDSFTNDEEPFIISVRRDGAAFVPEKSEAFDILGGLISPGTVYNARLSPRRMLLNWAIWLKNIFAFKPGTDKIRTAVAVQNRTIFSQLFPGDPRAIGDINSQDLDETEDLNLSDYPVSRAIFKPQWIKFKCRVTPDKIQMINAALKGGWDSSKNYGFIKYFDPTEGYVSGWPWALEYNFYTEEAQFTLLRKA